MKIKNKKNNPLTLILSPIGRGKDNFTCINLLPYWERENNPVALPSPLLKEDIDCYHRRIK